MVIMMNAVIWCTACHLGTTYRDWQSWIVSILTLLLGEYWILLHEIVFGDVRVRDDMLNQVLTKKEVPWLQIIWDVGVLNLRRKCCHFIWETINIFCYFSKHLIHNLHEFVLRNLFFPSNTSNNSHRNKFALAGFINVMKVCTLYWESLRHHSYQLF